MMRLSRLHGSEAGFTLVELLVASVVMALVSAVAIAGIWALQRTEDYTRADSEALGALRVAMSRFEKELRQARRVYPGSVGTHISFWVDSDRDNQQDPAERISWTVEDMGGGESRLVRSTDAGGSSAYVTRFLVTGDVFTYQPAPPDTTLVGVGFTADVEGGAGAAARSVETEVRLRNAATRD